MKVGGPQGITDTMVSNLLLKYNLFQDVRLKSISVAANVCRRNIIDHANDVEYDIEDDELSFDEERQLFFHKKMVIARQHLTHMAVLKDYQPIESHSQVIALYVTYLLNRNVIRKGQLCF
ncbi:hypothetical protein [Serratia silvae]|uniref:Uncharacterized protein n=1 Tax=Serratia silvae TaxID=2824122 RepID=A0ABT0K9W6_9GAMM|nr:hypothetical protein [Serratia silvae]MCL1028782.1 hypothetical protein [Serratia silvae]